MQIGRSNIIHVTAPKSSRRLVVCPSVRRSVGRYTSVKKDLYSIIWLLKPTYATVVTVETISTVVTVVTEVTIVTVVTVVTVGTEVTKKNFVTMIFFCP